MKKRRGIVLLLEAGLLCLMLGAVAFGVAETSSMAYVRATAESNALVARCIALNDNRLLQETAYTTISEGVSARIKTTVNGTNWWVQRDVGNEQKRPEPARRPVSISVFAGETDRTARYIYQTEILATNTGSSKLPAGLMFAYNGDDTKEKPGWIFNHQSDAPDYAKGRFILGAGEYSGKDDVSYKFRNLTSYGKPDHEIAVNELPTHSHKNGYITSHGVKMAPHWHGFEGIGDTSYSGPIYGFDKPNESWYAEFKTRPRSKVEKKYENLPPYKAVHFLITN